MQPEAKKTSDCFSRILLTEGSICCLRALFCNSVPLDKRMENKHFSFSLMIDIAVSH